MRSWVRRLVYLSAALAIGDSSATLAQDVGAVTSGNWNTGSTWTTGTAPGSSNNVYIGSTYPSGAASTATVTLTQAQSASNVYLGYGSGSNGTLNLAGNSLTVTGNLVIGQSNGIGTLNEAGGSFTAQNAYVQNGNSLTFGVSDVVSSLQLSGGSIASTAATGNITNANYLTSNVQSGSTLNLGANLNMNTGLLSVQDSGSTLNMAGHSITGDALYLGWYGSSGVTLEGRGALDLAYLYVGNGMAFNINAGDQVGNFYLSGGSSTLNANVATLQLSNGATAATTAAGGITNANYVSSNVSSGSTLNLGANLNMNTGLLSVQDSGSTLNMAGHSITGDALYLGWYGSSGVTLEGRGALDLAYLYVGNGMAFNINAGDQVGNFYLSGGSSTLNANVATLQLSNGATAATTAAGGITNANYVSSNVSSGSTLNLGANLNMNTGLLSVQDSGSTLNMAGHSITGDALYLGWYGSSGVTLEGRGALDLAYLYVGNGMAFNINAGDQVGNFYLSGGSSTLNANVATLQLSNGATAATTAAGGITNANYVSSNVSSGSTLNLGANLNMNTGLLSLQDSGSTLNAQGHALTAYTLSVGWNGTSPVSVTDLGQVTLTNLYVGNSTAGSDLTLHGGDVVNSLIDLRNGSVLTVQETNGIGLTLNGTSSSSLTIDPSSMDLVFTSPALDNWDFRWKDPSSTSNWINTIDSMIQGGQIVLTLLPGQSYQVADSGGYTYIYGIGGASVPEPSSVALFCMGTLGVMVAARWQRRCRDC